MFCLPLYSFFITALLCTRTVIYAEEYSECENKPVGSFIAVSNNCSKAIYCDGVDSSIVDCDNNNPYFSPDDELCYNNSNVCGNRPFSIEITSVTTTLSIPTILASVTATSVGFMPTIASNTIIGTSKTPTFSPNTELPINNAQTSVTILTTDSTSTTRIIPTQKPTTTIAYPNSWKPFVIPSSSNIPSTVTDPTISSPCPNTDDSYKPLFLPHPNSCSKYYLCYHGIAMVMECPNMLHFDASLLTCNIAEKAKCQVQSIIPREQCLAYTVDVYPHPFICNYYYICEYGFLMVMQCPFNMYWDDQRRRCTLKSQAKCYNAKFKN